MTIEDKPLKIVAKDNILMDILTLVIILGIVGATCIFIVPGFTIESELDNIPDITISVDEEPITVKFSPMREPTEIENLINDLMLHNPARKAQYAHHPDSVDDVHVCANMAVDQAEWIIDNRDYDVGIVVLHNKYIGDNHVQTWVDINDTRYVIDSTSNYYWDVEKHEGQWGSKYKIQYTTMEKGMELEKENNELINNKDEPQSAGCNNPLPIPTQIATPIVIRTPKSTPTITPTPEVPIELHGTGSYIRIKWQVNIHIADWLDDNRIIFGTASTRYGGWRPEDSLDQLKLIKIYVDEQLVATITPDVINNPNGGHQIMNNTCIIELPDGLTNSDEITVRGTFVDLISSDSWCNLVDGEYRMHTSVRLADDRYYDCPIYQG